MDLPEYSSCYDGMFTSRFIRHEAIKARIGSVQADPLFRVKQIGRSVQGREICCVSFGTGKTPVLAWSQMHGDEPTGTMALFDLLNFFQGDDQYNGLRQMILANCTLHFVPVLNPDGAEEYQRRNAQGIDINRDFRAQQTPEARALSKLQQEVQPVFGFNLHDQSTLWSVSGTKLPAAISLLAPPVDGIGSVTPARRRAMQLVVAVNRLLQGIIPGQVGRWSEEYEPRAVGETFQSLGTSTVLIESGGFEGDPEKQFLRQLNFKALLHAFRLIASGVYRTEPAEEYQRIPLNSKELFHLLIRNCRVSTSGGMIRADIGLNYTEERDGASGTMVKVYTVADFGDLSVWNAWDMIDAGNAEVSSAVRVDTRPTFSIISEQGVLFSVSNGLIV